MPPTGRGEWLPVSVEEERVMDYVTKNVDASSLSDVHILRFTRAFAGEKQRLKVRCPGVTAWMSRAISHLIFWLPCARRLLMTA